MSPASLLSATTRRRAIALWLALLLPAMQSLAGWHAISHLPVPSSEQLRSVEASGEDSRSAKLQACALCLTLAGVASAAPAANPAQAAALRAAPVMAPVVAAPRAGIANLLAYQGRAPPISAL
ncbi:MAG: DUF2946 family protein [Burkholderiaceae bacterium]